MDIILAILMVITEFIFAILFGIVFMLIASTIGFSTLTQCLAFWLGVLVGGTIGIRIFYR